MDTSKRTSRRRPVALAALVALVILTTVLAAWVVLDPPATGLDGRAFLALVTGACAVGIVALAER